MSEVRLTIFEADGTRVQFRGATVSEALAMKAEYLLNVGGLGEQKAEADEPQAPTTPKPSGFLSKVKGGTDG